MKRVAALALACTVVAARGACPELRAVNRSECPRNLDLEPCDAPNLGYGDLCEGDGECGTSDDLDNCRTDYVRADVYEIASGTLRPTPRPTFVAGTCPPLRAINATECPPTLFNVRRCDAGLAVGDLCEGDGSCDTDNRLDNCRYSDTKADVYAVVDGSAPTPVPTRRPSLPQPSCKGGRVLVPVSRHDCPGSLVERPCNASSLDFGDLCEGHGECGTSSELDNCRYGDVDADVYRVCKTKFDEDVRGVAKLFFDEKCVAKLHSSKFDNCAIKVLEDLINEYLGGYRIESFLLSSLSLLGSISLLQLGGVIRPSTTFGLVLWTLCFLGFLLEAVATLLGIIMVVIAYVLMRSEFRSCMLPWAHGFSLMDVTAIPSFLFVPPVLFRIVLLWVTICGLQEFIFVFQVCALVEERNFELAKQMAASDAKQPKPGLILRIVYCLRSLNTLWAFLGRSDSCCAWCIFCFVYVLPLLGFVFSLAFMLVPATFSFFLIIGVWPALALTFLLPCLFFYGIEKFSKRKCVGDFWKEQIHAVFWWSTAFLKFLTIIFLKVARLLCDLYKTKSTGLREMRSLPERLADLSSVLRESRTPFIKVVVVMFVLITLSPMFVYGSWLVAYSFSPRYNTDDTMHVVRVIYAYTFQIFNGFLPAIRGLEFSLDPRSLRNVQAVVGYLADLVNINAFSAQHYLDGARGMDALSLLISLCRSGVAYIAKLMAFLKLYGVEKTIEFYVLLGGGAVYHRTAKELAADPDFFGEDAGSTLPTRSISVDDSDAKTQTKITDYLKPRGDFTEGADFTEDESKSVCALS